MGNKRYLAPALALFLLSPVVAEGALVDVYMLARASGLIGIFILGSPVREVSGARGMLIVGIGAALFLYGISRRMGNTVEVAQWTGA